MTDIAPEILERVETIFQNKFTKDKTISALYWQVQQGTATYKEVNEYAVRTGELLAEALRRGVSSSDLPDGRMYYNIAERVLTPTLTNNYEIVSDVAAQVQESMNKAAGIGIKAIKPELNTDRIDGLVNKVSAAQSLEDVAWVLDEPVVNFTQSVVDDAIKANADFQARAGLRPKIIRTVVGGGCDWCAALAGTFDYGSEPKDVYRRHAYCRCQVTYDPGSGKRQNVHSKRWTDSGEADKIEERKKAGVSTLAMDLSRNPARLASFEPAQLIAAFEKEGMEVKPLKRGSLKDTPFSQGGGFKVNFEDGGLFQYHPADGSHHGGAYYKISTGQGGVKRYELDGTEKTD